MMGERDAAQAEVLILALSDVRDKMISQVTWLEKHGSQLDAVSLRRDIDEAQGHIVRLRRSYLGGQTAAAPRAEQARRQTQLGRI
jgi:hypothetical protein